MKNLISIMLTMGLTSLVSAVALAEGDPARGETLTATCVACHGADGNGTAPTFPKLAGLGERYLFNQLVDIKSLDRVVPEMTGMLDNLSEQDLADLAAYYNDQTMQLSGANEATVQVYTGEVVDGIALGEALYRAGNLEKNIPACTGCHSPRGLGNEPAAFPRLSGQYTQYSEKQLRDFRAGDRINDDAMIMRSIASRMSDAEIQAVANYISGLH